jgi:hypothetical protein
VGRKYLRALAVAGLATTAGGAQVLAGFPDDPGLFQFVCFAWASIAAGAAAMWSLDGPAAPASSGETQKKSFELVCM